MAQAAPYKWTLENVVFDDGSTASGSFVADTDTQTITQINISVTPGSVGGAVTFTQLCNEPPCASIPFLVDRQPDGDATGMNVMILSLNAPLPPNGGSVGLTVGTATCVNSDCSQSSSNLRTSISGNLLGILYAAVAPSAPNSALITDVGDSKVTLSWTSPADNGSPITKYTVTGMPGGSCTTIVVAPASEPATSCIISGLTNGTSYKFTVIATNDNGDSPSSPESAEAIPSADLKFVNAGPVIALPPGVKGAAYTQKLAVIGGLAPYSFTITGDLPDGLLFDTSTGIISGAPTLFGSYNFTATVSDRTVQATLQMKAMPIHVAQQAFTLQIDPAAEIKPTPVPTLGIFGGVLLTGLIASFTALARRKKSP